MFENSKNLSFCIKLGRLYPIIIITFEIKSTLYLDTKCNFILKQFIHLHTIFFKCALSLEAQTIHTIYIRNNMAQKCEGNCGLWVLHEILKKTYPEILKKIVGAVWELPAR